MYYFVIFILILAVRQQTAESARTTAHVLFQTQTPVSLADSYLTVDIAVPLPKLLNVDLRPIYKFSSKLQQFEQKTWKSSQFCNNPEISALLQHHFDGIISSIQTEYERAEKERTNLAKEIASFVNQKPDYHSSATETITTAVCNGSCDGDNFGTLTGKSRLQATLNFWSV